MVPKCPIFKALSDLRGAKIAEDVLKIGSLYLFVDPKWSKITFTNTHF